MITPADLLRQGFALVAVPPGEKGPIHKGWNRPENALTDPRDAYKLECSNIGLCHAFGRTRTCSLDLDDLMFANEWLRERGVDLPHLINSKDAVVIDSGRDNSLKVIYASPKSLGLPVSRTVYKQDHKSGLEIRCATADGLTVQDIIPPSRHPLGTTYRYIGMGDPLNPPPLPDELCAIWVDLNHAEALRRQRIHQRTMRVGIPETPRQVAEVKAALDRIDADCPYEVWRNICWAILSTGWQCGESLAYQWSVSAPNRFSEDAFWRVINSYDPDWEISLTIATVFHFAKYGRQSWQAS
jgi:hypothetical protein